MSSMLASCCVRCREVAAGSSAGGAVGAGTRCAAAAGRPAPGRGLAEAERLMHRPQRLDAVGLGPTSTEILMSPVVIIFMLTFSAASAANMRSATPVCVRMPVPTIDTLLTLLVELDGRAQLGGQRPQHLASVGRQLVARAR